MTITPITPITVQTLMTITPITGITVQTPITVIDQDFRHQFILPSSNPDIA